MRHILTATLLMTATAIPALADEVTGEILAYDRVANVIVLTDKTHWQLSDATVTDSDLVAGERVSIEFDGAGENGIGTITQVVREAN